MLENACHLTACMCTLLLLSLVDETFPFSVTLRALQSESEILLGKKGPYQNILLGSKGPAQKSVGIWLLFDRMLPLTTMFIFFNSCMSFTSQVKMDWSSAWSQSQVCRPNVVNWSVCLFTGWLNSPEVYNWRMGLHWRPGGYWKMGLCCRPGSHWRMGLCWR